MQCLFQLEKSHRRITKM